MGFAIAIFIAISLLLILPWVALILVPVGVTVGSIAYLITKGSFKLLSLMGWAEGREPVFYLGGLSFLHRLDRRVRHALEQALSIASVGTAPLACACVVPSGDHYVGTFRLHDDRGHYMKRVRGATRASVALRIIDACASADKACMCGGAVPETELCNPRTCPAGWRFAS